jgi:hypothetical protein
VCLKCRSSHLIDTKTCILKVKNIFKHFNPIGYHYVIAQIVAWENPTTSITSATQLGVRTIVTLAITPLILVMDDSTTREASQVTSREWRMKIKGFERSLFWSLDEDV